MKRALDLVCTLLSLVLFLPLLLLIAIFIRIDSPGPILYTPLMVGQNGRLFRLFRFRTMHPTATDLPGERQLTRIGRFIRNYSMDHLPMLINVLKGELTLIGPRPMELDRVELQDPAWQHYFAVKPGLFNYAVLKLGRLWTPVSLNHPSMNRDLELEYLQKRSASLDTELLFRSLLAWIASKGNIKERKEPDAEVKEKLYRDLD